MRWVDTNKAHMEETYEVRSRMVANNYKGADKGRGDLFAETPPLEAKRLLMSRAVTRIVDGTSRKLMFIDVKKAHLNPVCEEEVYLELPEECHCPPGYCGKFKGVSCGVVFYQQERDVSLVVHGDDFTFCGLMRIRDGLGDIWSHGLKLKLELC
eukprot:9107499-Karenia_brevis.AAC.1